MFWYIGAIISVILLVVGIILVNKSYNFETFGFILAFASGTFLLIAVLVIPLGTVIDKQAVNKFTRQKEYIENHISESDIEDAALTTKKIELNDWLYDAQYSKTNYAIFSFYQDEILEFEPIQ